jgi:CheY-like chemotaxis protein
LEEVRSEFSGVALSKGLRLEVSYPAVTARSDPILLGQMLRNLVGNAIRHTRQGVVRLHCEAEGERLRVDVQDTGVGIAQDQLDLIFDDFYQVGVAPNSVREGYGLGLSIVRRTAALLSHEVRVVSQLGHGSTFSILLPVATAAEEAQIPALSVAAPAAARRVHVLVVDDEPAVLNATRMLLKVEGFRVSTAESCEAAVALCAEQGDIQLLITDYHLGEGAVGTQVIDAVRRVLGAHLRAVLMTGDTSQAPTDTCRDERVRLARKPINADELLAVIDGLLAD